MFTIEYEDVTGQSKTQSFDSGNRLKLVQHLASFQRPILAVYERSTPITKLMQISLRNSGHNLGVHAREFAFKNLPSQTQTARQL